MLDRFCCDFQKYKGKHREYQCLNKSYKKFEKKKREKAEREKQGKQRGDNDKQYLSGKYVPKKSERERQNLRELSNQLKDSNKKINRAFIKDKELWPMFEKSKFFYSGKLHGNHCDHR